MAPRNARWQTYEMKKVPETLYRKDSIYERPPVFSMSDSAKYTAVTPMLGKITELYRLTDNSHHVSEGDISVFYSLTYHNQIGETFNEEALDTTRIAKRWLRHRQMKQERQQAPIHGNLKT
ncbi:unnamed protein product [Phytophthora lilii]|uniref:Unnamed protein product n=1 Tax=Phytophthora lilii TaxID=2077276 RepID=A0A9W6TET0_9STRA|nr:unnamed protein product [Phytophthora lilii]